MTFKLPEPAIAPSTFVVKGSLFGPLYTEAQLKQALKDVLEQAAVIAWNHYMDTCSANRVPPAAFQGWLAAGAIRKMIGEIK